MSKQRPHPESNAVYPHLQELIGVEVTIDGVSHTVTNDYIVVWALAIVHGHTYSSPKIMERANSEEEALTMIKAVYDAYMQEFQPGEEGPDDDAAA